MKKVLPSAGLYVITPDALCHSEPLLLKAVQAAIRGGAVMVQYRDKINDADTRLRQAKALQALCREAAVPFLLNDGPVSALSHSGLDGVHLGHSDGDLEEARRLAPSAWLGATCGQSIPRAVAAQAAGADYVAFGAFYASTTKPQAARASIELLSQARQAIHIPLCAIGGITPEKAAPLIAAGAHYIAAISGVFATGDIETAARDYSRLFPR